MVCKEYFKWKKYQHNLENKDLIKYQKYKKWIPWSSGNGLIFKY
jgi:hypothetical protein